jgi:CheY-like chemotaxis protein
MAGMHHILVVDDDPDVRDALVAALQAPGLTVHAARDGYEAVRVLVIHAVEVIVTDIRMPGMSGFELARQAKLMRPYIHVIYVTGYYSRREEITEPVDGALMFKPVRRPELMRTIRRKLDLNGTA